MATLYPSLEDLKVDQAMQVNCQAISLGPLLRLRDYSRVAKGGLSWIKVGGPWEFLIGPKACGSPVRGLLGRAGVQRPRQWDHSRWRRQAAADRPVSGARSVPVLPPLGFVQTPCPRASFQGKPCGRGVWPTQPPEALSSFHPTWGLSGFWELGAFWLIITLATAGSKWVVTFSGLQALGRTSLLRHGGVGSHIYWRVGYPLRPRAYLSPWPPASGSPKLQGLWGSDHSWAALPFHSQAQAKAVPRMPALPVRGKGDSQPPREWWEWGASGREWLLLAISESLPLACHRAMGTVYSCPLYFEGDAEKLWPCEGPDIPDLGPPRKAAQGDQDVCSGPGAALAILTGELRPNPSPHRAVSQSCLWVGWCQIKVTELNTKVIREGLCVRGCSQTIWGEDPHCQQVFPGLQSHLKNILHSWE